MASLELSIPNAQSSPVTLDSVIVVTRGRQRLEIRVSQFDSSRHRIKYDSAGAVSLIDGRKPLGVAHALPRRSIVSFSYVALGKKVEVSPRLWSDCYNLNVLSPQEVNRTVKVQELPGSAGMQVKLVAGDAAGTTEITWILRRDGRHSRRVTDPEPPP